MSFFQINFLWTFKMKNSLLFFNSARKMQIAGLVLIVASWEITNKNCCHFFFFLFFVVLQKCVGWRWKNSLVVCFNFVLASDWPSWFVYFNKACPIRRLHSSKLHPSNLYNRDYVLCMFVDWFEIRRLRNAWKMIWNIDTIKISFNFCVCLRYN